MKTATVEIWRDGEMQLLTVLSENSVYVPHFPFDWDEMRVLYGRRRIKTIKNTDLNVKFCGIDLMCLAIVMNQEKYTNLDLKVPWLKYSFVF